MLSSKLRSTLRRSLHVKFVRDFFRGGMIHLQWALVKGEELRLQAVFGLGTLSQAKKRNVWTCFLRAMAMSFSLPPSILAICGKWPPTGHRRTRKGEAWTICRQKAPQTLWQGVNVRLDWILTLPYPCVLNIIQIFVLCKLIQNAC